MPGFVDVSGMTYEDVRRMGHADDYDEETNRMSYRNPYAYRKPTPKAPTFSYDSDRVWGAAVVAFRVNKGYVKALAPGLPAHKTNRQIVDELLKDNVAILDDDINKGREIRKYYQAMTFKVIEGITLNPFTKSAMEIADKDVITSNLEIGTIASLPASYEKASKRDDVERRINWARGGFIGEVGDRSTQNIEIVKRLWSNNYNTWYYTGINEKDQVLFFPHKGELEIGSHVTIEGKVKSHRDTSTQFSHVKVI